MPTTRTRFIRIAAGLRARLECERGVALIVSIAASTTLAIAGTTAAVYSSQNYGVASYSAAGSSAHSLAEAGLNNAFAVLSKPGQNPANPSLLPAQTTQYDTGTVTWSGVLDEATGVWTLTSTGAKRNPTGTQVRDVRRTLTTSVQLQPAPTQPLKALAWNYIYNRQKGGTCDMLLTNSVQVASPLYVAGNLCMQNSATIVGGPLQVNGYLSMAQSANAVGSAAKISGEAHIAGGCRWTSLPLHKPCLYGAGALGFSNVWAAPLDAATGTTAPPTVDWNFWYLNSSPGPYYPCVSALGLPPVFDNDQGLRTSPSTTKRNNSLNTAGVFELTPASSYSCKTHLGELTWDANLRRLTINGTVFIDGSARVANGLVNTYVGHGSLYVSGTLLMKNSKLCAVVTLDGTACTVDGWNPNTALVAFAANGTGAIGGAAAQVPAGTGVQLVSSHLQGAVYATYAIDIDTTSRVDGPLNGSVVKLGQSSSSSWPGFQFVPAGMPGNSLEYPRVGPIGGYSG